MSTTVATSLAAQSDSHVSAQTRFPRLVRRIGGAIWAVLRSLAKLALAMVFTQNPLSSLLVVGWTNRATQRVIFRRWWKLSPARSVVGFDQFFAAEVESTTDSSGNSFGFLRRLGRAAWLNCKVGGQVIFNTWALTLPGCVIMLFSWQYGWNNSFFKGYENAAIGPLSGVFGIALLVAAMLYVPLATARQSATGNWKSFYEFRLIWRLVRRRALACAGLAALFALLAIPVNVLTVAPGLMAADDTDFARRIEAMSPDEAREFLNRYYLGSALVVVPAYVAVRFAAGRIYASAVLAEWRSGRSLGELSELERNAFLELQFSPGQPRALPAWRTSLNWTTGGGMATAAIAASIVLWFAFVAQIYVSEFLNYHAEYGLAWLNHPLIQLPWFRHIPAGLNP